MTTRTGWRLPGHARCYGRKREDPRVAGHRGGG